MQSEDTNANLQATSIKIETTKGQSEENIDDLIKWMTLTSTMSYERDFNKYYD
jgi:hypothetical protein